MRKFRIVGFMGALLGIFAFLIVPVTEVSAEFRRGNTISIAEYYGKRYRNWPHYQKKFKRNQNTHYKRKKGHMKQYDHSHNYDHYGFTYSLPFGSKRIRVKDVVYRYHNGIFYRKCKRGYDIVPAPLGALVRHLPPGYNTHYRRGQKYYQYDGTYYKKIRQGYRVVEDPQLYITYHDDDHHHAHYVSSKYRRDCY